MSKEMSKPSKKHEFHSNPLSSPPLSVDHLDLIKMLQLSKDDFPIEDGEQISINHDPLMTAPDFLSDKAAHIQPERTRGKRPQSKKRSVDNPNDVMNLLSAPSSTTNAKAMNKSSHSQTISRSNTAHHVNFLNSKEFAKFALSKVMPKSTKKEKALRLEQSPQQKRSPAGSLEKRSPPKNPGLTEPKPNSKKQKVKQRASNLTYNDFSSLMSQTQQTHSFMNSPQKMNSVYISMPSTNSTTNLKTIASKKSNQPQKSAWQHAANDAFKRLQASTRRKQDALSPQDEARSRERNKGIKSIVSTLNFRRGKKPSPEKGINSGSQAPNCHRKVASIGFESQNTFNSSHHTKGSIHKSPPKGKKSSNSPPKKETNVTKKKDVEPLNTKDLNLDDYDKFQNTFENLLEKYKCDMQNTQETYTMLKQAKQAYEKLINELLAQLKDNKPTKVTTQYKELEQKCETLSNENKALNEELKNVIVENQRLYSIINNFKPENIEPLKSDNKENIEKGRANPALKESNSNLRMQKVIEDQQDLIDTLQNKEMKLMQLLYTIHRQGFDVEKLLREELENEGGEEGQSDYHETHKNTEASGELEMCSLISSQDVSDIIPDSQQTIKVKYGVSDAKTSDTTPYFAVSGLGSPFKNKLKLDLNILSSNKKSTEQDITFPKT